MKRKIRSELFEKNESSVHMILIEKYKEPVINKIFYDSHIKAKYGLPIKCVKEIRGKKMREKYEEILKGYGIIGELDDVIAAVADMLSYKADKTEKEEPYAFISIENYRRASGEVDELQLD